MSQQSVKPAPSELPRIWTLLLGVFLGLPIWSALDFGQYRNVANDTKIRLSDLQITCAREVKILKARITVLETDLRLLRAAQSKIEPAAPDARDFVSNATDEFESDGPTLSHEVLHKELNSNIGTTTDLGSLIQ